MPEYLSRFHKDENPDCSCFENDKLRLVVIINPECILHGKIAGEAMEKVAGFTDEELVASAREDAFTGLIKVVSTKDNPALRDEIKPHFEEILKAIDSWKLAQNLST
jgi:hypothetical protein